MKHYFLSKPDAKNLVVEIFCDKYLLPEPTSSLIRALQQPLQEANMRMNYQRASFGLVSTYRSFFGVVQKDDPTHFGIDQMQYSERLQQFINITA